MFIFEEMRTAVEAAALDRLGDVAAAVWKAYGAGGLTDAEAEQLDGLLNARRGAARAAPVKMSTLAEPSTQLAKTCAPATEGQRAAAPASNRAHHRTGSRARTPESLARRRRMAAGGYLPPALVAAFTQGEQAVLAIVAMEVGMWGKCTLALGHMAALAGVCLTIAKRALRHARTLGLVEVEERKVSRSRNDTNVVRVTSRAWAAWLRTRLPRSSPAAFGGRGGTGVPSTSINSRYRATSTRENRGKGLAAQLECNARPTARAAGA
ncbi:hypothetical protein MKK69_25365 [Methylobacterium sp. J-026]|uniref:hypothetical protein n=1 Tax=Methylobacterium sp. J-026 TaxID=2836624 RepID=UPI001FBA9143|nr:hypothetical protein [Methylobacterium sp. J-026]MCJ2137335.1 hypothetical protein [Methylobacterium sp. J-026]